MFSIIISTCVQNDLHSRQLHRCISSIRKFHPKNKIFLINDSGIDINDISVAFENIIVIKTLKRGSADQQVFKIFLEKDNSEYAIIIQDSMILNKKLINVEQVEDIKFLWHFTNHRVHWDIIKEPKTDFNIQNNIITHTDLIKYHLLNRYADNKRFQKYALNALYNKDTWCGCFGNCCIITRDSLKYMNDQVNFVDEFVNNTSNRDRRVSESIFALICHFCYPNKNFEESYDELYYDGFSHGGKPQYIDKPTGFDNLIWCAVHDYFNKVSFKR